MSPIFRRRARSTPVSTLGNSSQKLLRQKAKGFESSWRQVLANCPDPDSQARLRWLQEQYGKRERGVSESAEAEIETAMLLIRAGLSLSFVKEGEYRTADFECYLDRDRLFVEVTVIVPTETAQFIEPGKQGMLETSNHEHDRDFFKDILVRRILARMAEKSFQLENYCAPILLAITIAYQAKGLTSNSRRHDRRMALDLQQLGGVMTAALASTPQLSGVLLTLQNIQPAVSRANIRLSNVTLGNWVSKGTGVTSVRLFVLNPFASYSLEQKMQVRLQRVL